MSPRLFDHSLLSASTSVDIFDVLLSSSFILFVSLLGSFRIFQARESLKWREIASFSPGAGWSHLLHHWWWWRYHLRKSSRCPKKCSLWLLWLDHLQGHRWHRKKSLISGSPNFSFQSLRTKDMNWREAFQTCRSRTTLDLQGFRRCRNARGKSMEKRQQYHKNGHSDKTGWDTRARIYVHLGRWQRCHKNS